MSTGLSYIQSLSQYAVIGRCDREIYYVYYYLILLVLTMVFKLTGSKVNVTLNPMYKNFHKVYNILLSLTSLALTVDAVRVLMRSNHDIKLSSLLDVSFCHVYPELIPSARVFFYVKFVEWFDSVHLLLKSCGDFSSISALHHVHHAIVPNMVCNGFQRNGEMFVIISNSFAHVLMYAYYAFPEGLQRYKSIITSIQTFQHFVALVGISYQAYNGCDMNYGILNIIGYAFFFVEFLKLLISGLFGAPKKLKKR